MKLPLLSDLKLRIRHPLWGVLCGVLLVVGCGEDAEVDPDAIVCGSNQPVKTVGEIGEVDAGHTATLIEGSLESRRVTLALGDVEFIPAGSDTPEMRPRILSITSNVGDPAGRGLLENLAQRIDRDGEEGRVFQVVSLETTEYCDVAAGKICVRFGLDDTGDGRLDVDKVVHLGVSGTVTFTQLTSTAISAEWDVTFGPNINRAFDASSGALEGCLSASIGGSVGDGDALENP